MSKKIAILDLNPFFGGGQKFLLLVQQYLSNRDAYYFMVTDKTTFEQIEGENKYFINESDTILTQIKKINSFIKLHDIEIMIFNGNRPIYFSLFVKVKKKIAYKHTSNNAFSIHKRFIGQLLLNFCYLFCDKIVLLFNNAKEEVFWSKEKIQVINNGVASPEFKNSKEFSANINFICVSRLDPNKGIEWLVKIFAETFGNNSNVKLKIAGLGPLSEPLNTYISANKINNIKLIGFVTDIQSELHRADVFILPSKFESFPLSILEAMSCGLPIIATNTGGVKDMVLNNKNGYVINYLNDIELKESLLNLFQDKELRKDQGNYSLKLFNENFTISQCVNKIEKLVYEI